MAGLGDYIKSGIDDVKRNPLPFIVGYLLAGIVSGLTLGILAGPMFVGYFAMFHKSKRGEPVEIGDLFKRIDKDAILTGIIFIAAIVAISIVFGILAAVAKVGAIALVGNLVTLAIQLLLAWAFMAQALKARPFMEAYMASIDVWKKDAVGALIALIVCGIFGYLGIIACGIGVLVTMPMGMGGMMAYYLDKQGLLPAPVAAPAAAPAPR